MSGWAAWRRPAGTGLVFVLSFSAVAAFLTGRAETARQNPDPWAIARQVERFAALRADLPPASVLAYYTDVPPEDERATVLYFGAAYAMAPHLVTDARGAAGLELVVGSFLRRPDLAALESQQGLKLVKDYGRGVMLFRREKR